VDVDEGVEIGKQLLEVLAHHGNGVGLAANQIGILKRVCVVNVGKPIILINPEIVGVFGKIEYNEGCLSFTGEEVITVRHQNVMVKNDYAKEIMAFYGEDRLSLLESVCVQHEIDHLNGITMHDRKKI
jgi:peptide deformylase